MNDKEKARIKGRMLKITGDCGHPWYVDTSELSDEVKSMVLKCPFCQCEGAPVNALLAEISTVKTGMKPTAFPKK